MSEKKNALELQTQEDKKPVCLVESVFREKKIFIEHDWLCPYCERVHEAITSIEDMISRVLAKFPIVAEDGKIEASVTLKKVAEKAYRLGQKSRKDSPSA